MNEYYVMSISVSDLEFAFYENGPTLVLISDRAVLQESLQPLRHRSVVSFEEVCAFYDAVDRICDGQCDDVDMESVRKILDCSPNYLLTSEEQTWMIEMSTISRFFELSQESSSSCVFSYYLSNEEWDF